jgi:hypothetical protein
MLGKACTKRLMLYTVASVVLGCAIMFFWKYCYLVFLWKVPLHTSAKSIGNWSGGFWSTSLYGSLYLLFLPSSIEDKRIL